MSKSFSPITSSFTSELIAIARAAGAAILAIYNAPDLINLQSKADQSPLTAADLAAHDLIARELPLLLDVPMISEESKLPEFAERKDWPAYWLIDPLDGTKEFVARNGEFTVNIALVLNGVPVLGVVHVPVSDVTYLGVDATIAAESKTRAERYVAGEKVADLACRSLVERKAAQLPLDVLVSHRHGTDEVTVLLEKLQAHWPVPLNRLSAGSSLKFCLIAEGRADFYPRLAPTSEWDTAAAQAVLVAAGGTVVRADNFVVLNCNQSVSLLNPSFLALGDAVADWRELLN